MLTLTQMCNLMECKCNIFVSVLFLDADGPTALILCFRHQKRELVRAFRRKARHLRNAPGLVPGIKMEADDTGSEDDDEDDEDEDSSETTEAEDGEGNQDTDGVIPELNSTAGVYATFVGSTDDLWNNDDDEDEDDKYAIYVLCCGVCLLWLVLFN